MKNVLLSLTVLVSLFATSCKKEAPVQPQTSSTSSINVEYRISSESGDVKISYDYPDGGKMVTKDETVNRTYYTINFTSTTGNTFSIQAFNEIPSHKVVQVQIYVNGALFKEGSASSPSEIAVAQGNYQ